MYIIAGLGNPTKQYENTRHNAGFGVIDYLSDKYQIPVKQAGFKALYGSGYIEGQKVILLKPQTFMNNSGVAVQALMTYYKIPLENIVVIHDDMDIPVGDCRVKVGGGSAGHNGIRSIDANVGREYKRVRIGIGHPRDYDLKIDPADWVLGRFTSDQLNKIADVISNINIFE